MEDYELDPSEIETGEEVILDGVKGTLESKSYNPSRDEYQFELENRKEVFTYPSSDIGFRKHSVDSVYVTDAVENSIDLGISNANALSKVLEEKDYQELEQAAIALDD